MEAACGAETKSNKAIVKIILASKNIVITYSLHTDDEMNAGSKHKQAVENVNIAKPIAFKH